LRIISKFKDFYDSGTAYGIDPNIVYVRHTYEVDDIHLTCPHLHGISILGFCGKLIPFYDYRGKWNNYQDNYEDIIKLPIESILIGEDVYKKCIETHATKYMGPGGTERRKIAWRISKLKGYRKTRLRNVYQNVKSAHYDDLIKIFKKVSAPIFIFNPQGPVIINPRLIDYNFTREFNIIDAFQQISQFIGNLNASNQMPEIQPATEKMNVQRHGMDKQSFRRNVHPGKPRGNK